MASRWCLAVLFVLLFHFRAIAAKKIYKCDAEPATGGQGCILRGVTAEAAEDMTEIELPAGQPVVQFVDCNIPTFDQALYDQLEETTNLTVRNCRTEKLSVVSHLVSLNVSWNKLNRLDRASGGGHPQLRVLVLSHNQFTRVPNIKDFTRLEVLDLSHNQLPFVNLELISRLVNLRTLDLSANRIDSLAMEGHFQLDHLTDLRSANNLLIEVDFTEWSLPALTDLDISENLLMYLSGDDLTEPFPSLRQLTLADNQWNCRGLSQLMESLQRRSVHFGGSVTPGCPAGKYSTIKGICCLDSHVNYVTLHSQWQIRQLQHEVRTMNETLVLKLAAVRDEQGAQIALLEQKLTDQEVALTRMKQHLQSMAGVIEDLIEELYLREMEQQEVRFQQRKQNSVKIAF